MNIPELPIDFGSIAGQSLSVFGTVIAALTGVWVLYTLIWTGFQWIRIAFSETAAHELLESEMDPVHPDDYDHYQRNIEQIEGEFASYGDVDDIPV